MLAQQGDEEAMAVLAQRYVPLLRHAVLSCGGDRQQQDDLEQEGFFGLLSAIRTYQPERSQAAFSTYAYVCVRNRVLSAVRRIRRREDREQLPEEPTEETVDSGRDPAVLVQERETKDRLSSLLRRELSELEYRVLRLSLQGFSYGEVGERLSISAKAVDNALQRVRRKLASCLREELS